MNYDTITVEQRGRVALLTLNRPEKLNAWTPAMMAEMRSAMEASVADNGTGAIVVTGAGRAFCAGADIDAVFKTNSEARDAAQPENVAPARAENWVSFLQNLPKPTIAAVNGAAVGIGVTQVLPMDIRIASEHARFGMFFVKMGLVPELASSALLPKMVGQARALDWCLSGRMIPAAEAREAGLVSEVVAADALVDRAIEIVNCFRTSLSQDEDTAVHYQNTEATDLPQCNGAKGPPRETYASWEHKGPRRLPRQRRQTSRSSRAAGR